MTLSNPERLYALDQFFLQVDLSNYDPDSKLCWHSADSALATSAVVVMANST